MCIKNCDDGVNRYCEPVMEIVRKKHISMKDLYEFLSGFPNAKEIPEITKLFGNSNSHLKDDTIEYLLWYPTQFLTKEEAMELFSAAEKHPYAHEFKYKRRLYPTSVSRK